MAGLLSLQHLWDWGGPERQVWGAGGRGLTLLSCKHSSHLLWSEGVGGPLFAWPSQVSQRVAFIEGIAPICPLISVSKARHCRTLLEGSEAVFMIYRHVTNSPQI
jgi:hypothetical protein